VRGRPANSLDGGGGAGAATIANALEVITGDPKVRSVLINIFGGITRCDLVAQGILDGFSRIDVRVPVVVRLDGTSAEEGRAILAKNEREGLVSAPTMLEAARRAVELAAAGALPAPFSAAGSGDSPQAATVVPPAPDSTDSSDRPSNVPRPAPPPTGPGDWPPPTEGGA
jgi:hypothetical protein